MPTRKLIPATIIPPELYVHREADRQLRNVIQDMGRPGYVLVARQMGKTNLLLNAKRELEDKDNAFIYVDLSIPLQNDRECFRHIVDTAIGTRSDVFANVGDSIIQARMESNIAAFKEHESELRSLLGAITGKLVIILDEIDSLTKGDFSDKVFAQIRSVYFSRINYPHLRRLTYVLSGVVEPNDIIKDKRISPFNIGEKIYLDDFTNSEFQDFLNRAGLDLKPEITDRIYYWANGNPRITWDICADLEVKIRNGYFASVEEVDNSVKKIYLADFNKAPVDHIREVVTDDDDLRNAITVIKYQKGDTLSDSIKNKLYLAGIVRSGVTYKEVRIKNKVIEAALSDQWLRDISIQRTGLLKLAAEKRIKKEYEEALALFEEYLAKNEPPDGEQDITYYDVGDCAYHLGEWNKALGYLEKCQLKKETSSILYHRWKTLLGICLLHLGRYEESRAAFQETLATQKKDSSYVVALINIGSSYTRSAEFSVAIETYQNAVSALNELDGDENEKASMLAAVYYNLANTYQKTGNVILSKEYFTNAIGVGLPEQKPAAMLGLYDLLTSQAQRKDILRNCIQHILDHKLRPTVLDTEKPLHFSKAHILILLGELFSLDRQLFEWLFQYAQENKALDAQRADILFQLAILSANKRNIKGAIELAEAVVAQDHTPLKPSDATTFETFRLLSLISKGSSKRKHADNYVSFLRSGYRPRALNQMDLNILAAHLGYYFKAQNPNEILKDIELIKSLRPLIQPSELGGFAIIYFFELSALKMQKHFTQLRACANEALNFIDSLTEPNGNELVLGKGGLSTLREFAVSNLSAAPDILIPEMLAQSPPKKRPPNERVTVRYQNGTLREKVKYKKIQDDLKNGLCVLVEEGGE
jgi:tetratricopeptide (TPR) repeat protein